MRIHFATPCVHLYLRVRPDPDNGRGSYRGRMQITVRPDPKTPWEDAGPVPTWELSSASIGHLLAETTRYLVTLGRLSIQDGTEIYHHCDSLVAQLRNAFDPGEPQR